MKGKREEKTTTMTEFLSTTPLIAKPSYTTQYIATLSAALGGFSAGATFGYSSPAGPMLQEASHAKWLPLSNPEVSWFTSSLNLGAIGGGLVGGLCINKLGRRGTMLACIPLYLLGWTLIIAAQNFTMLLVGRLVLGVCLGVTCIVVPTYTAEIASAVIRGRLGNGFQLMLTIGIVYSYVLGTGISNWRWLAAACGSTNLLQLVMVYFIKESPIYLLSKGKEEKAAQALQYYRGVNYNIAGEMMMMQQSLETSQFNKVRPRDFIRPQNLKPFLICLLLLVFVQLSGSFEIMFNMVVIIQESGSHLNQSLSVIVISLVQLVGSAAGIVLIDKWGRKALLIISTAAMSLSLVFFGEYFAMRARNSTWVTENLGWMPLVSLVIFMVTYAGGLGPVSWVMLGELLSPQVKEAAVSVAIAVYFTLAFIMTFTFTPLKERVGEGGVCLLFAITNFIALTFSVWVVPETKGLTLQQISQRFSYNSSSSDSKTPEVSCYEAI